MNERKDYTHWIVAIILAAYWWVVDSLVRKMAPFLFKSKDDDKSRASGYSSFLKGYESDSSKNISHLFEEMCIKNPLEYKDDPRLDAVIKDYSDLIKGRHLDPEGLHAPSLTIDGKDNPDYYRYLRNQKRALAKKGHDIEWITEEMARVTSKKNAENITTEFGEELVKRGMPEEALPFVLTYNRIETHSPEDWDALIKTVNEAVENNCPGKYMVEYFADVEDPMSYEGYILVDYSTLRDSGVPKSIALSVANLSITKSQATRAAIYVDRGYSDKEAIIKVLKEDRAETESADLVNDYRSRI